MPIDWNGDVPQTVLEVSPTAPASSISSYYEGWTWEEPVQRTGTEGDDIFNGTADRDSYIAGGGDDMVRGFGGNDNLTAGSGNDTVSGGDGNDNVSMGAGNDLVRGNAGNDNISGGTGNDRVYGDAGNDNLSGGAGNDRIVGGAGADRITGGTGNDVVTGGADADQFAFNGGTDKVTDFENNLDQIDLRQIDGIDTFADAIAGAEQVGTTAVLRFDEGNLQLLNTTLAQLDAGDFIL